MKIYVELKVYIAEGENEGMRVIDYKGFDDTTKIELTSLGEIYYYKPCIAFMNKVERERDK